MTTSFDILLVNFLFWRKILEIKFDFLGFESSFEISR